MKTMLIAVAVAVTACVFAASSVAAARTDPRACAQATPGGTAKHAYWCAKTAAVSAVRGAIAHRQHISRWDAPTFCNQTGTLLRWSCTSTLGGQTWKAAVVFRSTAAGWRARVTVTS